MKVAQWIILVLVVVRFFGMLYGDFNGRKESKPLGFQGAIGTIGSVAVWLFIYWKAGAFSTIFPEQ